MRRLAPAILLPLVLFAGCAISEKQEIEMGRQLHPQFEQKFGGVVPDARLQQYVQDVGMELARRGERPNLPWQFRVVNSSQVNAFALPGGYVYITRGLLEKLNNEAQLASVLGHESGHVAHRHTVKQIQQARGWQGFSAVAGVVGSYFGIGGVGNVAGLASQLVLLKYSRGQEKDADLSGLKYLAEAGYDPQAMVDTMKILEQASGGGGPQFLASHPNPGNRIEYLRKEIEKDYAPLARSGRLDSENDQRGVFGRSADGAEPAAERETPALQSPSNQLIGRPPPP